MNMERLRYLAAIAESRTFSEAAERLYTTQGNVSKQIQSLEKELGVVLVHRSGRGVSLTEAGQAVSVHARKILTEYTALWQTAASFSPSSRPAVRLCSIPVMAHYGIPEALAGFHSRCPRFRLEIHEQEAVEIPEELEKRRYDLAFTRTNQLDRELFEKLPFFQDRLAAVLPAGHPLAALPEIPLARLREEAFLQLGPSTNLFSTFQESCRQAGFEPDVAYTGTRMENILELVANGMGISLMMLHAASYTANPRIVIRPLAESIVSELSLIRLRHARHSPAARQFWEFFQEYRNASLTASAQSAHPRPGQ